MNFANEQDIVTTSIRHCRLPSRISEGSALGSLFCPSAKELFGLRERYVEVALVGRDIEADTVLPQKTLSGIAESAPRDKNGSFQQDGVPVFLIAACPGLRRSLWARQIEPCLVCTDQAQNIRDVA